MGAPAKRLLSPVASINTPKVEPQVCPIADAVTDRMGVVARLIAAGALAYVMAPFLR
jgi:hypothetical protein